MCSSEAISCEFKLCSNLPTFQYARADHLFSQPSSPRFRLNLSSSCRRADRYNQSFRSIPLFKMMVQDFEFLAFWCPSFVCFLVDLVDISCFLWRVPFPVVLVSVFWWKWRWWIWRLSPFVWFTMEGLSTMGYRHTESPTKSDKEREMFRSGSGT